MRQPIKKTLRELLEKKNFEQIAEVAVDRKRALSILVSLTFDADKQIAWRAVEAMGIAAESVARDDPQFVRNHLRKLYWLLSDMGIWRTYGNSESLSPYHCRIQQECYTLFYRSGV